MESNQMKGKLKEMQGKAKEAWGKLTDDQIQKWDGRKESAVRPYSASLW